MTDKPATEQPSNTQELLNEIEKLSLALNALSTQVGAHQQMMQVEMRGIKQDLLNKDEISVMIKEHVGTRLEDYLTSDQTTRLIQRFVGDAAAGLNQAINSGVQNINDNLNEFKRAVNKAIDANTNRINANTNQIDDHRDRDIQHESRIAKLESEFVDAREDRRRLREDIIGDGKEQRGLVGRIDGIENSQILSERTLAGILEIQKLQEQRQQEREQKKVVLAEIEAWKENNRRWYMKWIKRGVKVVASVSGGTPLILAVYEAIRQVIGG